MEGMTQEQKELFDKLTPLQQKVCTNVISGMSNIDSYINAGGKGESKSSQEASASRMLRDVKVKSFLDSMKQAAVTSAVMSREEMLEELSLLARTNQNDLITWGHRDVEVVNEDGETETKSQSFWTLNAMEDIKPEHLNAIEEVSVGKDGLKFKKVSKLAAMKQLADLAGYNAPQQVNSKVEQVTYTAEDYAKAQSGLESKLDDLD